MLNHVIFKKIIDIVYCTCGFQLKQAYEKSSNADYTSF